MPNSNPKSPHRSAHHLSIAVALVAAALAVACGPGGGGGTAPTVLSTLPADGAMDVARNASVSATFSGAMDRASLTTTTFRVESGNPAVAIAGTVTYGNSKADFFPAAHFSAGTRYTSTLTTGAKSDEGKALQASRSWTFTVGNAMAPVAPVELGSAGNYVIVAKSGVSTVPTSAITGNIAVSPAAASYITGFSLTADSTNVFATSPQVTGRIYAADYASPTPSNLTTAIGDMELAFTAAAARAADVTELGAGNIGGMTLAPGVYKWGSGVLIPTNLALSGPANSVWIFQIAQNLTVANATRVSLTGGAVPKNVFWQVSGQVSLGTTSHFEGVVLSQTSITLGTGASVNGRLLAQTAVDVDSSTIVQPAN